MGEPDTSRESLEGTPWMDSPVVRALLERAERAEDRQRVERERKDAVVRQHKETVAKWKARAERSEAALERLRETLDAAEARISRLRGQLPVDMQDCKIVFKLCPVGHGRLVATNWVDRGCPRCQAHAWRPIETAPRDGTRVLLSCGDKAFAYVGFWDDDQWQDGLTRFCLVSHWMPLPEPPAPTASLPAPPDVG